MNGGGVIQARMAAGGELVSADPPLAALQLDAGGNVGGPLVVPSIAHLARLALRLGVTISRPVHVASSGADVALWVRLKPDPTGVDIAIVEWNEQPRAADPVDMAALDAHAAFAREGWVWQVDAVLQFTMADAGDASVAHDLPRVGEPLSAYFRLLEGEGDVPLPLLSAVAARRPFANQLAVQRGPGSARYALAGIPALDHAGRLIGYRGKAVILQPAAEAQEQAPMFGRRLDDALRRPLSRIIANANTISGQHEGPLRADYAAYAADIAEAGRHLVELVDDLADLQAIDRPDFTAAQEEVDIADLARRAAGLLKMRAADNRIAIDAPQGEERILATAEYRRVLQILVNLIGNAVRYSPNDSRIWLRVDEDAEQGTVSVVVADEGRGIAPEDQERIFERFERLMPDDGAGSGLGLYISRRLARAMGGDIALESALGQGARFTLTLPVWRR